MTNISDLGIIDNYFGVNDHLQSVTHENIFAGGDCITIERYKGTNFPPKAGVYAVREGPVIARNIVNYIEGKPLETYTPQSGFLALLMTADSKSIGSKWNISFTG